ncbi:MAG TPA: MJ0042-type zinc finger domain-containing protein [Pyrinomonadaceae bacterium]|nr:MJ0042-type zinc finger domain-containing protein [Pyrinomonadaceae bacterium]
MNLVCPKCSSQLQVNNPPAAPFNVRCPKCEATIEASAASPASEKSALAVGQSPSTEPARYKRRGPAPLFEPEAATNEAATPSASEDLRTLLINLLDANAKTPASESPPSWSPRKVLVCTAEPHREKIARQLAQDGYQVFVAQDTGQAIDRMREHGLDIVVLDHEFDSAEQGAAFVTREVNTLRPVERRRLFFVLVSPVLRTMDAHAAFLHNANAIVNLRDVEDLRGILEIALREYNELYKDFNLSSNVSAI